ncbi:hypothetical protein SCHPADRAFT_156858 [Schizopora paradoxa]|uniref:MI domain-containing protein n=1 Tax=Schizopora paradoxa TaxID=27342 RepID=A0A0H2S101_9AGAM|nr:hypothetical protein SCHPADRAFT_156858 [Schizopora paradoxa]
MELAQREAGLLRTCSQAQITLAWRVLGSAHNRTTSQFHSTKCNSSSSSILCSLLAVLLLVCSLICNLCHTPVGPVTNQQYYPPPGAEYQMYPQQWHHPMNHVPGAPQPTPVHPSNMPVSPRQQPAPLQQAPATPPNIPPPLPSARLNSGASSFVPGAQGRIRITDASGHEINFRRPTSTTASPSPPPISLEKSQNRRPPVRIESEEERKKRVAEEEAKQKAKTDADSKAKKEKEDAELKARKKEEEEKERARKEEEDRLRAEEEEKKKKVEEEERIRKEEEEKLKREEEKKAEEERARKVAEEERLKKEAEEAEKAKKEAEEKERLEREAEVERLRKEAEEAEKKRREEEERKKQEERAKDEDSKSKTVAIDVPAKPSSAPEGNLDTVPPLSTSPESRKQRPIPGPLDLSSTNRSGIPPPLPSALATARHIQDLGQVSYPEGVASPRPDLNMNARDGKFRYDRDFLLQFMKVCVEKPDNLPNLEAIGLEPVDQNAMTRGGSGRRGGAMGPPSTTRSASIGLGINSGGSGFAKSSGFAMGQFSTPGKIPSTSEDRFMRSTSMGSGAGGLPFTGRPSPMIRTSSQGGAMPGGMGSKRTRSKRGEARNDSNRINSSGPSGLNYGQHMEPVAPLELSANRWVPMNNKKAGSDENSPEVIDRKVRALLNKLTLENFESISDQIIAWANKSEKEKDGRILIQVIRLVFEKATDEAKFSEMYAALCQKMMLQISPNISDESLDKPIRGGHLFRKYLLNRCQEDFERGWNATRVAAAAAAAKADEDLATKEANEKRAAKPGEEELYSDEYYVAQKAKRQGLGLVSLIGELFKLSMLTEKIMHGCIKKFLKDIDNPEEADIESLCTLLKIIGKSLDVDKANFHMNVYFERMGEISRKENISFRMKSMLLEVIELRQRKWVPRSTVQAAPTTIAQVHEAAARERAQKEREDMNRSMTMSRGGSRRGVDRGDVSVGPDGWAVAGGSGPVKTTTKAGDLSNFGKINKATPGSMSFGPSSVFSKKDSKRDSGSLSRTNSSSNMFHMLSQNPEIAAEVTQSTSSRGSRAPSRTASVDLSAAAVADIGVSRPKLNLLPRSKPTLDEASEKQEPSAGPSEANSDDESEKTGAPSSSLSSEKANEQIEKDFKEFFEARNITEGESYFTSLPSEYHHLLVDKLVSFAVESKEPNAKLVSDLFARAVEKSLCSPASFEEGFNSTAEALEDIAIDAPKAFDLMAIVMKGAALDEERRTRIAGKSEDGDKLLALLAA